MKKVLVTGATGYIGKNLVKKLLKDRFFVIALVRDKKQLPESFLKNPNFNFVEGDLSRMRSLKKAVAGANIVFHLAASLRMFEKNRELRQVNLEGLKNLLSVCSRGQKELKFVFASTIDVEKRKTDYARSKKKGERIVKEFCQKNLKISYLIVRIGNVYGGQGEGMVEGLTKIFNRKNWQASIIYHSLAKKRLYLIGMGNLVDKLIKLAEDPKVKNEILSLVDEELTINQLALRLKKERVISQLPPKIPLDSLILRFWQILGKTLKRGDLLVYLSLGK